MLKVTFETNIKDVKELRNELTEFVNKLDCSLPTYFSLKNLDWVKEQYEKCVLKVDGGYLRIKIESEKRKCLKDML